MHPSIYRSLYLALYLSIYTGREREKKICTHSSHRCREDYVECLSEESASEHTAKAKATAEESNPTDVQVCAWGVYIHQMLHACRAREIEGLAFLSHRETSKKQVSREKKTATAPTRRKKGKRDEGGRTDFPCPTLLLLYHLQKKVSHSPSVSCFILLFIPNWLSLPSRHLLPQHDVPLLFPSSFFRSPPPLTHVVTELC